MESKEIINQATDMVLTYGPKLVMALVVWIVGSWIIKLLIKAFGRALEKGNTDSSLKPFLSSIASTILKIMLVISVLGMMGVEMTSFIAILGAAGLAIGLALSGTLQNFAGGVMILIFKPFKVGDVINATGYVGSVSQIQIFNTILKTPDNKTILIPNGGLSNSSLTNLSTESRRRVDWTISIGYNDDVDKAKQVIQELCDKDQRILKDPAVFIAVSELADSSINFTVRTWVESADYWGVFFDMNENIVKSFAEQNINIPYPQMDVHVNNV